MHGGGINTNLLTVWKKKKALTGRLCVNCEVSNKHFIPGCAILLLSKSFPSRVLHSLLFFSLCIWRPALSAAASPLCNKGIILLGIGISGADEDCFAVQQLKRRAPSSGWCCTHLINDLGCQQRFRTTSFHCFWLPGMCLSGSIGCPQHVPSCVLYKWPDVRWFASALCSLQQSPLWALHVPWPQNPSPDRRAVLQGWGPHRWIYKMYIQ